MSGKGVNRDLPADILRERSEGRSHGLEETYRSWGVGAGGPSGRGRAGTKIAKPKDGLG